MSRAARLILAAVAVLVLALLVVDLLATRAVESAAGRALIHSHARGLLQRDIAYERVEVSLLPPAVVVRGLRVMHAEEGALPVVEAAELSVHLAWRPLLSRRLVVESITAREPTLRLTRTEHGLVPLLSAPGPAQDESASEGFALPGLVRLDGVRIEVADRSSSVPSQWVVDGVDATWRIGALRAGGELEIEAGGSSLIVGGRRYAAGDRPLRIAARVVSTPDAVGFEDLELRAGRLSAAGSVHLGAPGRALLSGRVELAEGNLPFELEALETDGGWQLRLQSAPAPIRVEHALAAFRLHQDSLLGALDLDADLHALAFGDEPLLSTLRGDVALRIAPGELRGISILRATLRALDDALGRGLLERLRLPTRERPLSHDLEAHDTDAFESLSASFTIFDGVAHTSDFRFVTPGYTFTMGGTIELAGLGLDATGEMRMGSALTHGLARGIGMEQLPLVHELVISIPRLGGTLLDPDPELDASAIWRLVTGALPGVRQGGELLNKGKDEAGGFFKAVGRRLSPR